MLNSIPTFFLGESEALEAGSALAAAFPDARFDAAVTSALTRSQRTLELIVSRLGGAERAPKETAETWRLNARHYGDATGLTREEAAKEHGEEQVEVRLTWSQKYTYTYILVTTGINVVRVSMTDLVTELYSRYLVTQNFILHMLQ